MGADDNKRAEGIVLTRRSREPRQRSIAIALALGVLVVLFFAVTMSRAAVLVRTMTEQCNR